MISKRMDCKEIRDRLMDLLCGELSKREEGRFLTHLSTCGVCSKEKENFPRAGTEVRLVDEQGRPVDWDSQGRSRAGGLPVLTAITETPSLTAGHGPQTDGSPWGTWLKGHSPLATFLAMSDCKACLSTFVSESMGRRSKTSSRSGTLYGAIPLESRNRAISLSVGGGGVRKTMQAHTLCPRTGSACRPQPLV